MKKLVTVSLILILVLAVMSCGQKTTTNDSASSDMSLAPLTEVKLENATEVTPEDSNANNSIGLMAFYPNDNENMYALAGTNTMTFYFESKRVNLGTGKIGIYEQASNAIYATRNAEDKDFFDIATMDEIGTALTGWEEGTKIDVYFDKVFLPGTSYFVLIDEGFFTLGTIKSGAVTNASLIKFSVKQYGIDVSTLDLNRNYNVDDIIALNVLCDGANASMFAFKEYDTAFLEVSPLNGTEDTTASIRFLQEGQPSFTVAFYNSGHEIDSISFTFNVGSGSVISSSAATDTSDIATESISN